MAALSRRRFLGTTTAGLAGILATRTAPAVGQTREISYLCWNNFAPNSDKKLAEIGPRFTKDTGIKIKIDHIAHPQQAAKYASEVQSQAGHDLVEMRMHFPWLYETQLVDLSDVVAELDAWPDADDFTALVSWLRQRFEVRFLEAPVLGRRVEDESSVALLEALAAG